MEGQSPILLGLGFDKNVIKSEIENNGVSWKDKVNMNELCYKLKWSEYYIMNVRYEWKSECGGPNKDNGF